MAAFTLEDLIADVRSRTDMVVNQAVSDDEITNWLNVGFAKTYDLLLTCYGENYWASQPVQFPIVASQAMYDLPTDPDTGAPFYKLLGVDLAITSGASPTPSSFITIKQFNFGERNRYNNGYGGVIVRNNPIDWRYRIQAGKLWFTPIPPAGTVVQVWMAPRWVELVAPSDTLPPLLVEGWEELAILDACIQVRLKTEEDVTEFKALKAETIERIKLAATNRDAGSPSTVVDVYSTGLADTWYGLLP